VLHLKVLHVVENLDRGAVENWLVRMLRHGLCHGLPLKWTFYCVVSKKGRLDQEVTELGARVIHSPVPLSNKLPFLRALRQELRLGRYDVLHCHHDLTSAVYLVAALGLPIRKRIVHVHNADESVPTPNRLKVALFRPVLRGICLLAADRIVGISQHALESFLADGKPRPERDVVHYYGVDSAPFETVESDRAVFRSELGVPDDCRILLFAGRMVPEKNPLFAVDVFAALHKLDPSVVAVFVGSGSLEEAVRRRARDLGLDQAFHFLGWRNDLPAIMMACDLFILPRPEHPMEGLGLAIVEAQLAGLRLLLSQGIADDPLLPTAAFLRLPLSAGVEKWAKAGCQLLEKPVAPRSDVLKALGSSPFDMDFASRELQELHRTHCSETPNRRNASNLRKWQS
jgi:glycosyltransferase involved in cell wall biosynthesis